jgi:glycosyltransferase involved in cell wall biosynthesis
MIEVAALTSGRRVPSSRFRVRQHVEPLRSLGVDVHEYVPAIDKYARLPGWPSGVSQVAVGPLYLLWQAVKVSSRLPAVLASHRHDVTWLQRELLPGYLTLEPALKRPLVLDIDDAIWLAKPFGRSATRALARRADLIVAGNRYLAEWFSGHNREVHVVPTAVDTDRFRARPRPDSGRASFVVGWTGTSGNLAFLRSIERPLARFLDEHPDARLRVVSDAPPGLTASGQVDYVPWSEDVEVAAVQEMDVGLMPLPDNEWTRGKCGFKMLQYMACGVAVVASPVGVNAEILAMAELGLAAREEADWYDALCWLHANRFKALQYGENGRSVAETRFGKEVVARQLAEIFRRFR